MAYREDTEIEPIELTDDELESQEPVVVDVQDEV